MSLPEPPPPPTSFLRSLYFRVLCGIALGVLLGVLVPDIAIELKALGDGFIKLVKMMIGPLIFCTVVVGIAGMQSMRAVGKTGGLALIYFEVMSTVALVIGLVIVNLVKPGGGMHVDITKLDGSKLSDYKGKLHSTTDFLLDIIPDTFVNAFAKGDLLPVLVISILFGFALQATGERGKPVFELIDRLGHVVFKIIAMIMQLAPLGACGAMAYTVAAFGFGTLSSLVELMACFYATCLVFVFGVLGGVAYVHGFSIFRFVAYIYEELLVVFGTSSSESVLPRMMAKLEAAGAGKPTVGLVIPTGYSFNLDGTSIYLTMAAMFIAQATDTPMDLGEQLGLLGVLLLTSKGAAGVTGSGFVVLAATLSTVGHVPVVGLALILGIDRFMSEARALTNVIGNGVATIVVAKWVGDLDEAKLSETL